VLRRCNMRALLALGLVACHREEEAQGTCRGTRYVDQGDDGSIDQQAALVLDSEQRTLSESYMVEDVGLVSIGSLYTETGLAEQEQRIGGVVEAWIRWERRTDGQPLREDIWNDSLGDGISTTLYEYDGDKLSRKDRVGQISTYHYGEDGRLTRIEIEGTFPSTVERWYSGPAPSLDGGFRTDSGRDGTYDVQMEEWYDGERLVAERGDFWGRPYDRSWSFREDGQLESSVELRGEELSETERLYDWRGLPTLELRTYDFESDGQIDTTVRTEWSWRCEAGR
jgi:hypothetical protein